MSIPRDMDRRRGLSSKLRFALPLLLLAGSTAAALTPGMRALYAARLAETAAGRFATLPLSPEVNPATDPAMDAVVQWDRLRRDNGPTSFAELAAFLRAHRGWPAETTLRRRAEKLIDDSVPPAARLDYFRAFPPLSAYARFRLAEARRATGDAALRRGRRAGGVDGGRARCGRARAQLLAEFGTALTPADHAARLDRLLWRGETSAAARMLTLVRSDARALAAARLAIEAGRRRRGAGGLTPAQRGDAGLLFDRGERRQARRQPRRGAAGDGRLCRCRPGWSPIPRRGSSCASSWPAGRCATASSTSPTVSPRATPPFRSAACSTSTASLSARR